jgi:hypothetical protein
MNYERLTESNISVESAAVVVAKKHSFKTELLNDLRQLNLLLWKNYSLQKRSVIATILEIFVPTLFVIILLPIRTIVKSDNYLNDTTYPEFSIDELPKSLFPQVSFESEKDDARSFASWDFCYHPNNTDFINKLMAKVGKDLDLNIICKHIKPLSLSY